MSVLSLSYWESDVTITDISQSLPHIMAENSWYEKITPLSFYVYMHGNEITNVTADYKWISLMKSTIMWCAQISSRFALLRRWPVRFCLRNNLTEITKITSSSEPSSQNLFFIISKLSLMCWVGPNFTYAFSAIDVKRSILLKTLKTQKAWREQKNASKFCFKILSVLCLNPEHA